MRLTMSPTDPTEEAVERARAIREKTDQALARTSELIRKVDELNDRVRSARGGSGAGPDRASG